MNVFTVSDRLILGRQTESGITTIQFPIKKWIETYGSGGTFHLWNRRSQDAEMYPVTISSDTEYVYWTPTYTDLAYNGRGEAVLDYTFGTLGQAGYRKACSETFETEVKRVPSSTNTTPAAYEAWVTQVESFADRAEAAAEEAESAVEEKFGDMTATATTLTAGSSATATYNSTTNVMSFGIPKGDPGEPGEPGTTDFDDMTNKPSYNGTAMTHATNIPEVKTSVWDGKYAKPSGGIPKSDLDSSVQTSLNKADSALQEHQSLSAYRTASAQDVIDGGKQPKLTAGENITIDANNVISATGGSGVSSFDDLTNRPKYNGSDMTHSTNVPEVKTATWDAKYDKPSGGIPDSDIASASVWNAKGTYSKPSDGIPSSDMTAAVQTSLGKADSALQEHQSLVAYRTSAAQDTIDAGKVPTSRTVNGKALTSDVTIADTDIAHGTSTVGATLGNHSTDIANLTSDKEDKSNKVTSISSASTDTQYPSAMAVLNHFNERNNIGKSRTFGIKGGSPLKITSSDSARIWCLSELGIGMIYGAGSSWNYVWLLGAQFSDFAYVEDNALKIGGFPGFKQFLFFNAEGSANFSF